MNADLIFYAVSRRKWPRLNKNGIFAPEDFDAEEGMLCAQPDNLKEYLNKYYKGRKNLFLLVIDVSRLSTNIQKKKEGNYIMLHSPVNTDAILDKIRIDCNQDGLFDLSVKSYT